jgi:hypothetical protein
MGERCKHGIDMPELCCVYCRPQPELSGTPRPRICYACKQPVEAAYLAPDGTRHKRLCSLSCYEMWQDEENHRVRGRNTPEANQKRSTTIKRAWTPEKRREAAERGRQRDMSAVIEGNRLYWTPERRAAKAKQMRQWHESKPH